MTTNIISFKKKLTIEQRDIDFLKKHLTNLRNTEPLLVGYFNRPFLAKPELRQTLYDLLFGTLQLTMDFLIEDLGDGGQQQSENAYDQYSGLIDWFKNVTEEGERHAITLYCGEEHGGVMQCIFMNAPNHELALIGIYDSNRDVVSGIIQKMNDRGMSLLGFDIPSELE